MICSVVRRIGSAILLALLTLALSGTLRAQDGPTLYKTKCIVCHAADGSGSTAMGKSMGVKDLRSDEVQKQSDAQLNAAITNGMAGGKMPAYKGKLKDDQITELVKFIRSLKK